MMDAGNAAGSLGKNAPKVVVDDILITSLVSPEEFTYVKCADVRDAAHSIRELEEKLSPLCTDERAKASYEKNDYVIVQFNGIMPSRMLRGIIVNRKNNEYLVFLTDCGFTLCCMAKDMWPLPEEFSKHDLEFHIGGLGFIMPSDGVEWSLSCTRVLDTVVQQAVRLAFAIQFTTETANFGKLTIQPVNESPFDASQFLVDRKYANHGSMGVKPTGLRIQDFDLAVVNDASSEPPRRVENIFELLDEAASSLDCLMRQPEAKMHLEKLAGKKKETTYVDISFNLAKTLNHTESWSEETREVPVQASPEVLDEILLCRNVLTIPETARRLSKVSSSSDSFVESGLDVRPLRVKPKDSMAPGVKLGEPRVNMTPKIKMGEPRVKTATEVKPMLVKLKDNMAPGVKLGEPSVKIASEVKPMRVKMIKPIPAKIDAEVALRHAGKTGICIQKPQAINHRSLGNRLVGKTLQPVMEKPPVSMPVSLKKVESASVHVLAHSSEPVSPYTDFDRAPVCRDISTALKDRSMHTLLPSQQYAWAHLADKGSMILINGSGKCRSWCYLPMLCSEVVKSLQADTTTGSGGQYGPLAILLADSVENATKLSKIIEFLTSKFICDCPTVVNGPAETKQNLYLTLLASCGILVTTLPLLQELVACDRRVIDKDRLEFFIVDDLDRMNLGPGVLLDLHDQLQNTPSSKMQTVVVAQRWKAKSFEKLVRQMRNPLILFGDFLEAAMYGHLSFDIVVKHSDAKKIFLLEYLKKSRAQKKRTIICCKNIAEMTELKHLLATASYCTIDTDQAQDQTPNQLLMASDELQPLELPVHHIDLLIHWSLPRNWTHFVWRFHCMKDNIANMFAVPQNENAKPITSLLLLDEENKNEMRRVGNFLLAHDVALDEHMAKLVKTCNDEWNRGLPICPYFSLDGQCSEIRCNKRHEFIEGDTTGAVNPITQPGTVIRCKLIKIYNPARMAVWPLKYKARASECWTPVADLPNQRTLELEIGMAASKRKKKTYNLHDVCVVRLNGNYQRVRIVDLPPKHPAVVQLMDFGVEIVQVRLSELLECPEEMFRTMPPLALNMWLSDMVPSCETGKWSTASMEWIVGAFSKLSDNAHIQITVNFDWQHAVHAREIVIIEECRSMRISVYRLRLRQELLQRGFAEKNTKLFESAKAMYEKNMPAAPQTDLQKIENTPEGSEGHKKTNNVVAKVDTAASEPVNNKLDESPKEGLKDFKTLSTDEVKVQVEQGGEVSKVASNTKIKPEIRTANIPSPIINAMVSRTMEILKDLKLQTTKEVKMQEEKQGIENASVPVNNKLDVSPKEGLKDFKTLTTDEVKTQVEQGGEVSKVAFNNELLAEVTTANIPSAKINAMVSQTEEIMKDFKFSTTKEVKIQEEKHGIENANIEVSKVVSAASDPVNNQLLVDVTTDESISSPKINGAVCEAGDVLKDLKNGTIKDDKIQEANQGIENVNKEQTKVNSAASDPVNNQLLVDVTTDESISSPKINGAVYEVEDVLKDFQNLTIKDDKIQEANQGIENANKEQTKVNSAAADPVNNQLLVGDATVENIPSPKVCEVGEISKDSKTLPTKLSACDSEDTLDITTELNAVSNINKRMDKAEKDVEQEAALDPNVATKGEISKDSKTLPTKLSACDSEDTLDITTELNVVSNTNKRMDKAEKDVEQEAALDPNVATKGEISKDSKTLPTKLSACDSEDTLDITTELNVVSNTNKRMDKAEKDVEQEAALDPNVATKESSAAFLNCLIKGLGSTSPTHKKETQDFLSIMLGKDAPEETPTQCKTASGVRSIKAAPPPPEAVSTSIRYLTTVDGAVHPKVKWHQNASHIVLILEQKAPEYNLVHLKSALIYTANKISPPHCCIMNLLGEVAIVSEKQVGYNLHVKLAKLGQQVYWPSLLNSVYAQQSAHWLVYDMERDQEPEQKKGQRLWDDYEAKKPEEDHEYRDFPSPDESDGSTICDFLEE